MKIDNELQKGLTLMAQGKEEGFNILYSHTHNFVYQRARLIMKNEEDALDLTQETFIQAYKGINSLQDSNNVNAWLSSVVYKQGMRMFRKKQDLLVNDEAEGIFDNVVSEDMDTSPEDATQAKVTSEIVMGMIEELPELQRAAIIAFYYDNMKIDDIATLFECSPNTIKSRLNYAKKFLQDKVIAHEKANRYKLCSISPAIILLALKSLFATEKYTLSTTTASAIYSGAQGTLFGAIAETGAVSATMAASTTAAVSATATTATQASVGLSLGMKIAIAAIAVTATTTVGVAVATSGFGTLGHTPTTEISSSAESSSGHEENDTTTNIEDTQTPEQTDTEKEENQEKTIVSLPIKHSYYTLDGTLTGYKIYQYDNKGQEVKLEE